VTSKTKVPAQRCTKFTMLQYYHSNGIKLLWSFLFRAVPLVSIVVLKLNELHETNLAVLVVEAATQKAVSSEHMMR
jgi:hypothetical protein